MEEHILTEDSLRLVDYFKENKIPLYIDKDQAE